MKTADRSHRPDPSELKDVEAEIDVGVAPLVTVEDAAKLLSTTPTALRARCRRHARRMGREVVARLGAGVVAFKFGVSWRVRFEPL